MLKNLIGKINKKTLTNVLKALCVSSAALILTFASGCGFFEGLFDPEEPEDDIVTISQTEAEVVEGKSITLTATSSLNRKINWSSFDEEKATVEDGVVTGVAIGSTTITASDGMKSADCEVTVIADETLKDGFTLIWNDEFEGDTLDLSKWSYQTGTRDTYGEGGPENWGNAELQYYSENNVTVSNGELTITAKRESMGGKDFTSGRITTRGKFSQTFGYYEARIKMPAGKGMWPAFWMLPQPLNESSSHNEYGGWARNGELDILEAQGMHPDRVCGTIHYGDNWPNNQYSTKEYKFENSTYEEWHTYAIDWTEDYITWYVDGKPYNSIKNTVYYSAAPAAANRPGAPFDKPFYILFNLAVDSGKFDPASKGGPDEGFTQASMTVDYVRAYVRN